MTLSIYDDITNTIIEQLSQVNPLDYSKPWFNIGTAPYNATTKKSYRGINHIILGFKPFSSKAYASFKQWHDNGCTVNKGSKGSRIVYWNFTEDKDTGKTSAFLRHYTVFNSEQCTGDFARQCEQPLKPLNTVDDIANANTFTSDYLARESINLINTDVAYYSPSKDIISMPYLGQFTNAQDYYSVLLHEMTHSTGNAKRLNRDLANSFGSKEYAKEELIAELGAAMLCGNLNITNTPRPDHAQYIASWLKVLENDKRFIIQAAGKAQKACDYITQYKASEAQETELETLAA